MVSSKKREPVKKRESSREVAQAAGVEQDDGARLYQRLARRLAGELAAGKFAVGDRLPAERELSVEYGVSRPAVREAMIALEVQGLIEVRVGSGAYVLRLPGQEDRQGFNVTAFELMEARLVFEGEAAALAAVHITDEELGQLDALIKQMADENRKPGVSEDADHAFHRVVAAATRNSAVSGVIEGMWRLRSTSPECALLLQKARTANVRPVVKEHKAVLDALRKRDAVAARTAMRAHLQAVIDHLLFAIEEEALAEARKTVESKRARFARAAKL